LREKFGKTKIKVVFLVRENQKWSYQGLYEKLKQDERFEPIVAISLLTLAHKGKDKTRQNLSENAEFFKKRGIDFVYAYRNKKYIDLREFNPDIVFYDQHWDIPQIHSPYNVSKFALTCYVPYGYGVLDFKADYTKNFHKLLYRFFVENELNIQRFETYESGNSKNCIALGQPKLDAYLNNSSVPAIWKDENKLKIIYAPHHSFDKNGLNFATFQENGKFILELAKKYQNQTTWIFKPHPRFRYACWRRKIMTLKESENYYKEWENIGIIYEAGDYFEIFKTSDLMISDCCSFLAEYLPANKPYIRLVSDNMSVKFNSIGEKILNCCYEAKNNMDIEKYFRDIIINKNDNKREIRSKIIPLVIDFEETSSAKIYRNIVEELERGE
jgi:CDP-glycerol glycerophosphotransferase (TagB/SpsB family)